MSLFLFLWPKIHYCASMARDDRLAHTTSPPLLDPCRPQTGCRVHTEKSAHRAWNTNVHKSVATETAGVNLAWKAVDTLLRRHSMQNLVLSTRAEIHRGQISWARRLARWGLWVSMKCASHVSLAYLAGFRSPV